MREIYQDIIVAARELKQDRASVYLDAEVYVGKRKHLKLMALNAYPALSLALTN